MVAVERSRRPLETRAIKYLQQLYVSGNMNVSTLDSSSLLCCPFLYRIRPTIAKWQVLEPDSAYYLNKEAAVISYSGLNRE